mgnify:FL=1
MKIQIILLCELIVTSCCPKLYPHKMENTEHTVTITETVRDTIIRVQPDSSIVQALIRCDSTGRARLEEIRTLKESARVQQTLALKDNKLTAKTVVDSMGIFLTYKELYREEQKIQVVETIIEKEVNVLIWWQIALIWIGTAALVFVLGKIIAILILRKPI